MPFQMSNLNNTIETKLKIKPYNIIAAICYIIIIPCKTKKTLGTILFIVL